MAGILSRKASLAAPAGERCCSSSRPPAAVVSSRRAAPVPQHICSSRPSVLARGWSEDGGNKGEKALFGEDFGARDPTTQEIETNFGEKSQGNFDTEHVIKVPTKIKNFVGLTSRSCTPEGAQEAVGEKDINLMKQQLPGWKVVKSKAEHLTLRYDWRLKSPESAAQLQGMINDLAQAEGHSVLSMEASGEMLFVEMSTPAVGGPSMNDFALAAKVNELDIKDLVPPPRKKFWA